jgi:AAA domain, putative AbiEii toxin, Type IV TA system
MIHRIEIENYGSIREAQVIDLTLPATTPTMDRFVASHGAPHIRLPTVVAFFGPNAAGKTTVLRAIASTIDFVVHSFSLAPNASIPYFQPFRSTTWATRPTRIVIDFDAKWIGATGYIYRYQLTIGHGEQRTAERVHSESLLIRDGRRFRALFRRDERGIRCARELDLPASDSRLKAVRDNASLISTMAQLNHPMLRTAWEDIRLTQKNIFGFKLARPDIGDAIRFLHENRDAQHALLTELSRLDLGLRDMAIAISTQGLRASFGHEGLDHAILLEEESNGTQRFLAMFPALWATLQEGRPALLDEFDVDLHPLLIPELLNWFHAPDINQNKAQLFLAAHNVAIMDDLEKEEIFLVDKSSDGASSVIPLRDIAGLRREPSLQRKYLGGVFGAIPNIG